MAITNYGSKDVAVSFGSAVTAMLFPTTDVERKAIIQESTPFGVAWKKFLDTGARELSPLTFSGIEDFAASTGSRALFAEGTSATLTVTYGGSKTTSCTALVVSYKTAIVSEKLHVFTVQLQPTGTVTEA
jgi:hypothetical protein